MPTATEEYTGLSVHGPIVDPEDAAWQQRSDTWAKRPLDHLKPFSDDEANPHPRRLPKRTRNQMRAYSEQYLRRWGRAVRKVRTSRERERLELELLSPASASYAKWYASLPAAAKLSEQRTHCGFTGDKAEAYILGKVEVS